jgi:predicted signal transduction protein with EAL and GGDEF domain
LTETLVMHNPQQALMTLSRLADAGIGLTLDDFGTGHSSLSYLTRFPFQTIKIDKSLVIDPSDKGGMLIRSIVNLAKQLEMQRGCRGRGFRETMRSSSPRWAVTMGRASCSDRRSVRNPCRNCSRNAFR